MTSKNDGNRAVSTERICEEATYQNQHDALLKMRSHVSEQSDAQMKQLADQMSQKVGRDLSVVNRAHFNQEHSKNENDKNEEGNHKNSGKENSNKDNGINENRKKSGQPGKLPEKQFLPRESLLTEIFATGHGRSVYNVFVVAFAVLVINAAVDDVVAERLDLGFRFVGWNFGGILRAALLWCCMTASTFAVYWAFHLWADGREKLSPSVRWAFDRLCLAGLVAYQASFLVFPLMYAIRSHLHPTTTLIVLTEQVRMIMKTHAFVRSNAPRALSLPRSAPRPPFAHYVYFLFCPTLVYRDAYPRTNAIRWKFVATNFAEVVGVVFFVAHLFQRYLVPAHRDYNVAPSTHGERIALVFGAMLPGMLSYALLFYCIIHSWMNAWAELTRFADRMFYQDWWAANGYGSYYRRWNVVVHDWLYAYVYKDIVETFRPNGRLLPTAAVFVLSAVVHEYILAFTFGFFCPMMLVTFGTLGTSLVFLKSDKSAAGNVFVWLLLSTGTGFMASVYCMEWFSRVNCASPERGDLEDFFVPRLFTCVSRGG